MAAADAARSETRTDRRDGHKKLRSQKKQNAKGQIRIEPPEVKQNSA